ncbi:MAG: CIA30 family protein [Pseudomonadota bacterium]
MRIIFLTLFSACLSGGLGLAQEPACRTVVEHSAADAQNPWQTVNDGVMGGLSIGGSTLQGETLSFTGVTNTDGGGFSSIRLGIPRGSLAGADHLKIHMKRDARAYSMTLRTNARSFGRRIAFRSEILGAPEGVWGDGILSFDSLRASIWGRSVPDAVFDPSETVEIGLIIYDGKDGPFELQLKRIEACQSAVRSKA